jgi:hypothetical protein
MRLNDDEQAFKTALFGNSGNTVTRSYIATLMRLTDNVPADLRVGVQTSKTERHAYWLDGHTLGSLSCLGEADLEDTAIDDQANISGGVIQLNSASVHLAVKNRFDTQRNTTESGRVLTLRSAGDDKIVLDASPTGTGDHTHLDAFIDKVLDTLAGQPAASTH